MSNDLVLQKLLKQDYTKNSFQILSYLSSTNYLTSPTLLFLNSLLFLQRLIKLAIPTRLFFLSMFHDNFFYLNHHHCMWVRDTSERGSCFLDSFFKFPTIYTIHTSHSLAFYFFYFSFLLRKVLPISHTCKRTKKLQQYPTSHKQYYSFKNDHDQINCKLEPFSTHQWLLLISL